MPNTSEDAPTSPPDTHPEGSQGRLRPPDGNGAAGEDHGGNRPEECRSEEDRPERSRPESGRAEEPGGEAPRNEQAQPEQAQPEQAQPEEVHPEKVQTERAQNGEKGPRPNTERNGAEAIRLTLRRAAELHGISPSYLSRRVREGKPAKGYELAEYAQIEDGRVEGFEFPLGYEFPEGEPKGWERAPTTPAEKVSVEEGANEKSSAEEGPVEAGGGGAPEASEGGEEGSAPEGRSGASPEASGEGAPEVRDGFAATAEAFRAGKEAWGALQRVGPGGKPRHLEYFSSDDPATAERVAEKYGAGTYRLSRMAGGHDVHFTFEVSRQAPSEVERRLAAADEVEHRNQYLEERRHEAEKRAERLEREVEELIETLGEEIQKRERLESELRIFRESFEDELEWEKKQLRWEMEDKVAEQTLELREEKRKLEKTIRKMEREHDREVKDLKWQMGQMEHEHELEKIKLKNKNQWPEKVVELASEAAVVFEKNPDVLWGLGYRLLKASGLEDLAQKLMRNWREARAETSPRGQTQGEGRRAGQEGSSGREGPSGQGAAAQDSGRRSSSSQEKEGGGDAESGGELQNIFRESLLEALREGELAEPTDSERAGEGRRRRKAPLRPEVSVWQAFCPRR